MRNSFRSCISYILITISKYFIYFIFYYCNIFLSNTFNFYIISIYLCSLFYFYYLIFHFGTEHVFKQQLTKIVEHRTNHGLVEKRKHHGWKWNKTISSIKKGWKINNLKIIEFIIFLYLSIFVCVSFYSLSLYLEKIF